MGRSEQQNASFYVQRAGAMLECIGDLSESAAPLEILDAGCGQGWFAWRLHEAGFAVTAFDASATAITQAQSLGSGPQFVHSTFDRFRARCPFDIVVSIDVLFHLTDDTDFVRALVRLADLTRRGGRLLVTDRDVESAERLGDYIVHRPIHEYISVLQPRGFELEQFRPYRFPGNPIGFIVFSRKLSS